MDRVAVRFSLVAFYLLASLSGQTRDQPGIDSLLQLLKTDISDKKKVEVYVEIASSYQNYDSLKTAWYGNKAIELARDLNFAEGTIDPLYPIGVTTMRQGHYAEAEQLFTRMADLAITNNYQKGKAGAFYGLGWLNCYRGKYEQALNYLIRSVTIQEELGDKNGLALGYNIIGIIFDKQGNCNRALEYYFLSLEINEELGKKAGMASNLSNIGIIYKNQGNYEKALGYYRKALQINEEIGRKRGMASNYGNLGMIYYNQDHYEEALDYHLQALKIREDLGDKRGVASSYHQIGQAYMELGDYTQALEYLSGSLKIYEDIGIKADRTYPMICIGETYRKRNQLPKARKHLRAGIDLAQQTGLLTNVRDGAKQLAQVEKELGNYEEAYKAHVLFKQMADSLNNEERVKKITRLEAEYEFRKERDSLQFAQQQEMILLEEEAKRIENRKQAIYIILGLILITGIICYVAINQIVQRKKVESLRNHISRDLHDEIGSTLSSISLFGTVASKSIQEAPDKTCQLLKRINSNATNTIESMNDIVWAIKTENDSMLHLVNRMRSYASEIEETGEWEIQILYDPAIGEKNLDMIQRRNIYLIFKEALNNAVKYSEGNAIDVEIRPVQNSMLVEIKDNGQGFEPKQAMQNGYSFGGNGLKNMKRRAAELGGELSIISASGQGTRVSLLIHPKQNVLSASYFPFLHPKTQRSQRPETSKRFGFHPIAEAIHT